MEQSVSRKQGHGYPNNTAWSSIKIRPCGSSAVRRIFIYSPSPDTTIQRAGEVSPLNWPKQLRKPFEPVSHRGKTGSEKPDN